MPKLITNQGIHRVHLVRGVLETIAHIYVYCLIHMPIRLPNNAKSLHMCISDRTSLGTRLIGCTTTKTRVFTLCGLYRCNSC